MPKSPDDRRFHLVLPTTHRTIVLPRPKPAQIRHVPLLPKIRAHIDHLQILAIEDPEFMHGIMNAAAMMAGQCRKRRMQR